jgi:hypothetical protein
MMKTLTLNYSDAHDFVAKNSHRGYFWDGWNINRWVPNSSGYMSKNGDFRNDRWGMKFVFPVENDGTWSVKVPANVQYN